MKKARIVADVTAHGFGHLAQMSAALNALSKQATDIDLIIRTAHSPEIVTSFIKVPHRLSTPAPDIGMLMTGPSAVDAARTFKAYQQLHNRLDQIVEHESEYLQALSPDLLISNISYTSLLAAEVAGIPSLAFCSLNWADIFEGYCGEMPGADKMIAQMRKGYQAAHTFLRPTPSMPMTWHHHSVEIGVIARQAVPIPRPAMLPPPDTNDRPDFILVGLGGIKSDYDPCSLPKHPAIHWIIPQKAAAPDRSDCTGIDQMKVRFLDLLPLCAAVLTKSGYGTFAEAAAHGTRVLYAARPDWPEAASLEPWINAHTTATPISQHQLYDGSFEDELLALLARPSTVPITATGAEGASKYLTSML